MHHTSRTEPISGQLRYERVLGGAFVMQHWSDDHPDFPDALSLLSETQSHYFDVRGIVRMFDLRLDDAGWTMVHLDQDFSQRFETRFEGADALQGTGEASSDGGITWRPDFTITSRRLL
ncbi:hypothetical protein [Deinococcus alpinitundrae]|uniref:hypothetical protein n=1 Tax=Deinococcus alpinitundrae TaxID=468913 RepID=UPI00137B782B|nr:hypothetical protein [Deinococcus alpinitundrae]